MEDSKVVVLIISNNEFKTAKVFNSEYDTDDYIESQADDCACSNETFGCAVLNKDSLDLINATFKEKADED